MEQYEKRTDLALEVREQFPEDHVEIEGVVLKKESDRNKALKVTTVEIINDTGAKQMKKPIGSYVTLEFSLSAWDAKEMERRKKEVSAQLGVILRRMVQKALLNSKNKGPNLILLSGLGNRFATPDALGPYVMEHVLVNRHVSDGGASQENAYLLCGIAPGVMSQTGIETSEILKGLIEKTNPALMIVVDSLASSSVNRLCHTIQITDTGIAPGAGIGNNRNIINQETMGVPVIAVGVPTVVDAGTIIYEALENTFLKEGYQESQIQSLYQMLAGEEIKNLFVTPKDIDEEIRIVGEMIARGVNTLL
ncbi:MAG: GPR endopeptidase [Clostridiaceae bacterium]|nr:GPR endopeptidase [Clostridiaceae bacterium]